MLEALECEMLKNKFGPRKNRKSRLLQVAYNHKRFRRYAVKKNPLEFLAEWLALEKQFMRMFSSLREVGGTELIDQIYGYIYSGDLNSLYSINTPQFMANLKVPPDKAEQVSQALTSIVQIVQSIGDQQIFSQLMGLIKTKDKSAILQQVLDAAKDDMVSFFSRELLAEINANPGLAPVLRSGRLGMGAAPGAARAKLTTDMLDSELSSAFANQGPWVTNFLNLLTTLMHRSVISKASINSLVPEVGEVDVTPQQDFAFVTMVESGADPSSREAQYDVLKWVESTESTPNTNIGDFEEKFPNVKALEMIKKTADLVGTDGFVKHGKDINIFNKLYDILSTTRKPQSVKWEGSELKGALDAAGLNSVIVRDLLYNSNMSFEQILLQEIPEVYHDLYLTARDVTSLSPEQQEAYKQQYPEIGKILEGSSENGVENGLRVRTTQLLLLKKAVTQAWGNHFKRFHEQVEQMFPGVNADKFVQMIFLDDDLPLRDEISEVGQKLGLSVDQIVKSEDEHELVEIRNLIKFGKSKKEQGLLNLVGRLIRSVRARNEFMIGADIQDLAAFREVLAQKGYLLNLNNLFGNIPGVARLWSQPTVVAGKQVLDPAFAGQISRSDILRAASFNPLAANTTFREALNRNREESVEDYKDRMAILVRSLVDQGQLYVGEDSNESPLSAALASRPITGNTAIKAINQVIKSVIAQESQDSSSMVSFEAGSEDLASDLAVDLASKTISESEMQRRQDHKNVLEDLFSRENMTAEDTGVLSLNPSTTQNIVDPEFADVGFRLTAR
jgi:hypothetical protein